MLTKDFLFFLSVSQSHATACAKVCFSSSVCWYERTRLCHNTLLVFCGQEEPGSAPVTQLLTAHVLSFALTSSTCLLILRLYSSLSPLGNVSTEAFWINSPDPLSEAQLIVSNLNIYFTQWHIWRRSLRLCMAGSPDLLSVLVWTHTRRVLGKCIPLLHWQQM